jgi:Flp pilus assembly pilin Flp
MMKSLIRFAASESGVTAVEYALMLGLMVLVIITEPRLALLRETVGRCFAG